MSFIVRVFLIVCMVGFVPSMAAGVESLPPLPSINPSDAARQWTKQTTHSTQEQQAFLIAYEAAATINSRLDYQYASSLKPGHSFLDLSSTRSHQLEDLSTDKVTEWNEQAEVTKHEFNQIASLHREELLDHILTELGNTQSMDVGILAAIESGINSGFQSSTVQPPMPGTSTLFETTQNWLASKIPTEKVIEHAMGGTLGTLVKTQGASVMESEEGKRLIAQSQKEMVIDILKTTEGAKLLLTVESKSEKILDLGQEQVKTAITHTIPTKNSFDINLYTKEQAQNILENSKKNVEFLNKKLEMKKKAEKAEILKLKTNATPLVKKIPLNNNRTLKSPIPKKSATELQKIKAEKLATLKLRKEKALQKTRDQAKAKLIASTKAKAKAVAMARLKAEQMKTKQTALAAKKIAASKLAAEKKANALKAATARKAAATKNAADRKANQLKQNAANKLTVEQRKADAAKKSEERKQLAAQQSAAHKAAVDQRKTELINKALARKEALAKKEADKKAAWLAKANESKSNSNQLNKSNKPNDVNNQPTNTNQQQQINPTNSQPNTLQP